MLDEDSLLASAILVEAVAELVPGALGGLPVELEEGLADRAKRVNEACSSVRSRLAIVLVDLACVTELPTVRHGFLEVARNGHVRDKATGWARVTSDELP